MEPGLELSPNRLARHAKWLHEKPVYTLPEEEHHRLEIVQMESLGLKFVCRMGDQLIYEWVAPLHTADLTDGLA